MSFLAPLYIAGILAVSLPIIFHLIRRTPTGRMPFSTLMFLQPSPPKITRRRQIDNWLLLLLRAIAVCLLAFAFARPFLRQAAETHANAGAGKRVVLLVDISASMRRGNLWKDANDRVNTMLSNLSANDELAMLAFDGHMTRLLGFQEWNELPNAARRELPIERMKAMKPSWGSTNLGLALITACSVVDHDDGTENGRAKKEIVLISDLQAGSQVDALQSYEWPSDVALTVETISTTQKTNAGVQLVSSTILEKAGGQMRPRVRISNAADSQRDQFTIQWSDRSNSSEENTVYVPAGENRVVRAPELPETGLSFRLQLSGDDHGFDNTAWFTRPATETLRVIYFGDDEADDPMQARYYVERAFPETGRREVEVIAHDQSAPLIVNSQVDVHLMIITGALTDPHRRSIQQYIKRGGTAVYVTATTAAVNELGLLLEINQLHGEEADVDQYAMLTDIDFEHPLFAPFSDPRFADFTKLHIWKHRKIDVGMMESARILASFDDGDPALIEIPHGKGRAFVFATGWHPDDSQLALSSKFVPLLNGILDYGLGRPDLPLSFNVGESVPILHATDRDDRDTSIQLPDHETVQLAAAVDSFSKTVQPGIYTIETKSNDSKPSANTDTSRFAVNLAADESKTAPMAVEKLEVLGVKLESSTAEDTEIDKASQRQLLARELENKQRFWRWLILAALAVLVIETWLAGRTARNIQGA